MDGLALTTLEVTPLSPVEGAQLYEFAPPAVSVVKLPPQAYELPDTVIVGLLFTYTSMVFVSLPDVTLYVVVIVGEATTDAPVVELSPVEGDQL